MNYNEIMGPLTNVLNWIETNLINGLLGNGFGVIKNIISSPSTFQPFFEFFNALLSIFAAA